MAVQQTAVSVGGIGAGVGSTLLIRDQFDQTGETTILRPSVLWGLLTGGAALGAPFVMDMARSNSMLWNFVEDYGEAALGAAAFSAFSPKGSSGLTMPTI